MDDTIATFIVSYNMPERAEALAQHINKHSAWPCDVYLIDNGSDIQPPAPSTNVWVKPNRQTTGGWLAGVDAAKASGKNYLGYWFIITSAEFVDDRDPLTPCAKILVDDPNAVMVHPSLTADSTTIWTHMIDRGSNGPRRVWHVDVIASLYRADWYNAIGGFDPALYMAHGICLESAWFARAQGRSIWVQEACQIKKVTNIGYAMNRMNMTGDERLVKAKANMDDVLARKWGGNYWERLRFEMVRDEWK
jgi:hypothetical protein